MFYNPSITINIFLFLTLFIPSGIIAQSQPYKVMLDDPVQYSGPDSLSKEISEIESIEIGFFAPNDECHPAGQQLWQGCQLAVEEFNRAGGLFGKPLRLIQRWSDDPWGNGSKEMIKLVYQDQVWAVIGSINSETSHIAEQIITKARVPLISPLSGDLSLNYTRIPWIFRLAPSNREQCQWLVRQIRQHSRNRIGIIASTQYDYRIMANEFGDQLEKHQMTPVFRFDVNDLVDIHDILIKMNAFKMDALFISLPTGKLNKLITKSTLPVFSPWFAENENLAQSDQALVAFQPQIKNKNFEKQYYQHYQTMPSPSAGYGYDAIHLIAQAIKSAGLSRSGIREKLQNINDFNGVMGTIRWDNGGSNITISPADHECGNQMK